jgi:hypothetical protein
MNRMCSAPKLLHHTTRWEREQFLARTAHDLLLIDARNILTGLVTGQVQFRAPFHGDCSILIER